MNSGADDVLRFAPSIEDLPMTFEIILFALLTLISGLVGLVAVKTRHHESNLSVLNGDLVPGERTPPVSIAREPKTGFEIRGYEGTRRAIELPRIIS